MNGICGVRSALVAVLLTMTIRTATAAIADSDRLIVNQQIGDVRAGESRAHVTYYYGTGRKHGCVIGVIGCLGPIYRYRIEEGHLDVGYRTVNQHKRRIPARVVYLATNSPHYRTASGLEVGTRIPYGKRWGVFRWLQCGPGEVGWTAGTSWRRPFWKYGRYRWWTRLYVDRGVVRTIAIWRGDVSLQGC